MTCLPDWYAPAVTPAAADYGRYALLACLPVIAIVVLLVTAIVVALVRRQAW